MRLRIDCKIDFNDPYYIECKKYPICPDACTILATYDFGTMKTSLISTEGYNSLLKGHFTGNHMTKLLATDPTILAKLVTYEI